MDPRVDLIGYFRSRIGRNLHSVVDYDDSSWDLLYAGESARSATTDDVESLVDYARSMEGEENGITFYGSDLRCSVWCFDQTVVLHLPRSDRRNVVVALEPMAASRLLSVVSDCQEILSE